MDKQPLLHLPAGLQSTWPIKYGSRLVRYYYIVVRDQIMLFDGLVVASKLYTLL